MSVTVLDCDALEEVRVTRRHSAVRFLGLCSLLVLIPITAIRTQGQAGQSPAAGRLVALRGGTVLTVTNGTIPNGTVLLRDGKIAAVGGNVTVPAGAEIVDTTGQFVSPGIIDAHSHIANDAINEGGTTVSSMTGMEDVLDPTDVDIYRDLAGGTRQRASPKAAIQQGGVEEERIANSCSMVAWDVRSSFLPSSCEGFT